MKLARFLFSRRFEVIVTPLSSDKKHNLYNVYAILRPFYIKIICVYNVLIGGVELM